MRILEILDWVRKAMNDRLGALIISFLLGCAIPSCGCILFYWDLKNYENQIMELSQDNDELLCELKEWQHRAFSSDSLCIEKMRNMAEFFKGLNGDYQEQIQSTKSTLRNTKKSIREQTQVKEELEKLKTKVSDYE